MQYRVIFTNGATLTVEAESFLVNTSSAGIRELELIGNEQKVGVLAGASVAAIVQEEAVTEYLAPCELYSTTPAEE